MIKYATVRLSPLGKWVDPRTTSETPEECRKRTLELDAEKPEFARAHEPKWVRRVEDNATQTT